MSNLNQEDERHVADAYLTLERADAARLGRKIREHNERLALLPAFKATVAFTALYPKDNQRNRVACEATALLAIWDNKFFVLGWLALVSCSSIPIWLGRSPWIFLTILVLSTAILVVVVSNRHLVLDTLKDELARDLAALQPVLGEDPLKWTADIVDKADLADFIDEKLSTELREMGNSRDRRSLTILWTTMLTGRFGMQFPKTRETLRATR